MGSCSGMLHIRSVPKGEPGAGLKCRIRDEGVAAGVWGFGLIPQNPHRVPKAVLWAKYGHEFYGEVRARVSCCMQSNLYSLTFDVEHFLHLQTNFCSQ